MPQQDPNLPDSIVLGAFTGLKNTVAAERLSGSELQLATNIDLDDSGQARRRRGYKRKDSSSWHSIRDLGGKVYGVKDGLLGIIRADYSFFSLGVTVGASAVCYAEVDGNIYFSSAATQGIITSAETVLDWGATNGQGLWLSPVISPTDTLGAISGKLLGDPQRATAIEPYKGRIYLARNKTLWATMLYLYNYVDRTKDFMQFEHDITLVMAMSDGLYIGTTEGLYFIEGTMGAFKLNMLLSAAVLPGSGVWTTADVVHPQARNSPVPTGQTAIFMTSDGVIAGFDGGSCYNLTHDKVIFPGAVSAAAMLRQDLGDNHYVAAMDSAGGPAANTRIGDFVDVQVRRAFDRIIPTTAAVHIGDSVTATVQH